ncbi:hypothetical protein [Abiotrophia defectiva]|uniref:hypothetical protein n=1 Tax=Abiotrophia defectiva TaxID=46125 RepID=UPI0026F0B97D|nr:hypothetical protein [Abiotrophia defectiva]
MALNTVEAAKIFQTALDKKVEKQLTSAWMEVPSNFVQYDGGDEVKLPSIVVDGLGNYDRDGGYTVGGVTLSWNTYKLTQDRGRAFLLDAMMVNETNFILTATTVMDEFQRTQVVPEIDAYRYSKLASVAKSDNTTAKSYTKPDELYSAIKKDIAKLQDAGVDFSNIILTISAGALSTLEESEMAARRMNYSKLADGEVGGRILKLGDVEVSVVPQNRLVTEIQVNDGKTSGQEKGGWAKASSAKDINYILCPKDAPQAVTKQDIIRIFSPEQNQKANAWSIDYRRFHDLWVPESKKSLVIVSTTA